MATCYTIKGLFGKGSGHFEIPKYQRAYSWEREQWVQFLDDLKEAESVYYLGHFLFESDGDGRHFIIDGQQRLTTCAIFVSAALDLLGKEEDCKRDVRIWRRRFLEGPDLGPRMKTVPLDNAVFQDCIVSGKPAPMTFPTQSAENLVEARKFFTKGLSQLDVEGICRLINRLEDALVTTFEVPDRAMAARVFAFQNDRGKSLTALEKSKAWLMHQVYRNAEAEEAENFAWTVEKAFSEIYCFTESLLESEDTVLGWHRQAFLDGGDGTALDAIKRALAAAPDKIGWIVDFAAKLAQTFRFVLELEAVEERRDSLIADICCLDKHSAMPLLVKLRHHRIIIVSDEGGEALALIESILFKLTFRTADYRTNNLPQFARTFDGTNYSSFLLPALRNAAVNGFKSYWDFTGSCRKFFTENRYHYIREIKYVLYKYENHLRDVRKETHLSIDECNGIFRENKSVENTLDHIAPQNPDWTDYTDEFRLNYLSNIGNLSLLTWSGNASKSNHDPTLPEVRERYNTPQWSQKEIYETLCAGHWGEAEIEDRRKRIVDFVIDNWKLA